MTNLSRGYPIRKMTPDGPRPAPNAEGACGITDLHARFDNVWIAEGPRGLIPLILRYKNVVTHCYSKKPVVKNMQDVGADVVSYILYPTYSILRMWVG